MPWRRHHEPLVRALARHDRTLPRSLLPNVDLLIVTGRAGPSRMLLDLDLTFPALRLVRFGFPGGRPPHCVSAREWRNGRRAGFRCQCPKGRGGSNPPSRTHEQSPEQWKRCLGACSLVTETASRPHQDLRRPIVMRSWTPDSTGFILDPGLDRFHSGLFGPGCDVLGGPAVIASAGLVVGNLVLSGLPPDPVDAKAGHL